MTPWQWKLKLLVLQVFGGHGHGLEVHLNQGTRCWGNIRWREFSRASPCRHGAGTAEQEQVGSRSEGTVKAEQEHDLAASCPEVYVGVAFA